MELITRTEPKLLIADEGKQLRSINDVYIPEKKDEQGNIIEPAHFPYYSTLIFLGKQVETLEQAQEIYVEEEIGKEE